MEIWVVIVLLVCCAITFFFIGCLVGAILEQKLDYEMNDKGKTMAFEMLNDRTTKLEKEVKQINIDLHSPPVVKQWWEDKQNLEPTCKTSVMEL